MPNWRDSETDKDKDSETEKAVDLTYIQDLFIYEQGSVQPVKITLTITTISLIMVLVIIICCCSKRCRKATCGLVDRLGLCVKGVTKCMKNRQTKRTLIINGMLTQLQEQINRKEVSE